MSTRAPFNGSAGSTRALRAHPVAVLVTLVAALSLVAGGIVVLRISEQITNEADTRLAGHAGDQAAAVDDVLTSATRDLRLASRNIVFADALRSPSTALEGTQRAMLERAIQYTGQRYAVDEICLIRRDGVEMARYNGGAIAAVEDLSPDESVNNPAFAPALAVPDDHAIRTEPYISPDSGRWVFGLATPIVDADGVGGLLHFELPIAAFGEALERHPFGHAGSTFVLTNDGRLLVHPDIVQFRAAAGLPADPDTADFPMAVARGGNGWQAAIGHILGGSTSGQYESVSGAVRFEARPILDGTAYAVTVSPTTELYADVNRAQLNLLVTVGPLAVLIVALTAWFGRRLFSSNRRLAQAMQASAELASIVASADDAILSVDRSGRIVTWNEGAERAFGLSKSTVLGTPAVDLFPPDHQEEAGLHLDAVAHGESVDRFETVIRSVTGERIDAMLTLSPVRTIEGNLAGMSVIARDISARKRLEEQLEHQALHDSLTGLPNRALFGDRLDHALARRRRPVSTVGGAAIGVLFIDLDDFKVINDTLGHKVGDELLVEVGHRIQAAVRPGDTAARLGGDEFTVLLEDLTDPGEARAVASRILEHLATPFRLDGHDVVIGASIGIMLGDNDSGTPDEILRGADTALYEAKAKGKGQHATFHAEMGEKAWYRLELEAELRRAISDRQLIVEYQPIVDLATGDLHELEALVRWRHPDRGMIPPNDFIPLAEQTGLIVSIGAQVLEIACRDVVELRRHRPEFSRIGLSVNISPRELRRSDLIDSIVATCAATGLPLADLRVEITEGLQLDDAGSIARVIELRDRGVRVSIDDFGTGYSSLASFRNMPIDGLKLDRMFVSALGKAREETAIVTAAIGFGDALGVAVTGEGIETAEQLTLLRKLGCRFGQGFLISRPKPIAAVRELQAPFELPTRAPATDRTTAA